MFQVTKRLSQGGMQWNWISNDDLFLNGAVFVQSGSFPEALRARSLKPMPGTRVEVITRNAGVLRCRKGRRGRC
jgi:pectate lyase